jgi:hypothetical protein
MTPEQTQKLMERFTPAERKHIVAIWHKMPERYQHGATYLTTYLVYRPFFPKGTDSDLATSTQAKFAAMNPVEQTAFIPFLLLADAA